MKQFVCLISRISAVLFLFFISCDHGLSPETADNVSNNGQITGISGTLYFFNWPPADSLYDLRLVAFKNYPPGDIFTEILGGQAFFYPDAADTMDFYIDSLTYVFELEPAAYKLIAVALQFGPNPSLNWKFTGQYDTTPQDTLPTSVVVENKKLLENIDIYVSF